jgi:hypothetical protein
MHKQLSQVYKSVVAEAHSDYAGDRGMYMINFRMKVAAACGKEGDHL